MVSIITPSFNSSAFISFMIPSLIVLHFCGVNSFSASIDYSAFATCITPIIAFNITIAIIMNESI